MSKILFIKMKEIYNCFTSVGDFSSGIDFLDLVTIGRVLVKMEVVDMNY